MQLLLKIIYFVLGFLKNDFFICQSQHELKLEKEKKVFFINLFNPCNRGCRVLFFYNEICYFLYFQKSTSNLFTYLYLYKYGYSNGEFFRTQLNYKIV